MSSSCCASGKEPLFERGWIDPTLEDCCDVEAREERAYEEYMKQLRDADTTNARAVAYNSVLSPEPVASSQVPELDAELETLRGLRLQQLKKAATGAQYEQGRLRRASKAEVQAFASGSSARLIVCHMPSTKDRMLQESVDRTLESLASKYAGTAFLSAFAELSDENRAPVLVAFVDNKPRGELELLKFVKHMDSLETEVARFLRSLGMLEQVPKASINNSGNVSEEESEASEASLPLCTTCGRSYPHEHVKPVRLAPEQHIDTDDSDDLDF